MQSKHGNYKTVKKDVKEVLSKWGSSVCVKTGQLNDDEPLALLKLI